MVYVYNNILTKEVCDEIIDKSKPFFEEAGILGEQLEGYRTAQDMSMEEDDEITIYIKTIIEELAECKKEQMESLTIVKYEKGGEYKPHHDFFHETEDYFDEITEQTGNRKKTALFYLNDNFKGGGTEFTKLNLKIQPEIGKLVLWDNMSEDGIVDYNSEHAGLPVEEGVKYIAVIWIREKSFKTPKK